MTDRLSGASRRLSEDDPKRFVFVLLDKFTMLSFASALDCLRIANRMAGRDVYQWRLIGEGGALVSCSAGTTFKLQSDLEDLQRDDVIILCGGEDVQAATTKKLLNWIRREARRGLTIGGLCTAAYAMARLRRGGTKWNWGSLWLTSCLCRRPVVARVSPSIAFVWIACITGLGFTMRISLSAAPWMKSQRA